LLLLSKSYLFGFSFSSPKYLVPPISTAFCWSKTIESYGMPYDKSSGVQTMEQSGLHAFKVVLMPKVAATPYLIHYLVGIDVILQVKFKWYFLLRQAKIFVQRCHVSIEGSLMVYAYDMSSKQRQVKFVEVIVEKQSHIHQLAQPHTLRQEMMMGMNHQMHKRVCYTERFYFRSVHRYCAIPFIYLVLNFGVMDISCAIFERFVRIGHFVCWSRRSVLQGV